MQITPMEVLDFVKTELGYPYMIIEIPDEQIMNNIIQKEALLMYSNYYPYVETRTLTDDMLAENWMRKPPAGFTKLSTTIKFTKTNRDDSYKFGKKDSLLKVPPNESPANMTASNMIKIDDEDLIRVVKVLSGIEEIGFTQFDKHKYLLHWDIDTYWGNSTVIQMHKTHRQDLSSMNYEDFNRFKKLCLILTAKKILPIRRYNSQISTPIGEITVDVETVQMIADSLPEFIEKELDNVRTFAKNRTVFKIA